MNRKVLCAMLVVLTLLVGCDSDRISNNHRLQALNEAGAAYGLEFNQARGGIPDMPDGAVVYTDIDGRGKVITEIFLEDSSFLREVAVNYSPDREIPYFVSEEHRTAVFCDNIYYLEEDPILAELNDYIIGRYKKRMILTLKALDSWPVDEDVFFRTEDGRGISNGLKNAYVIGEFLYNEIHNPESLYYQIDEETPETVVNEIVYNSLRETQSIKKRKNEDKSPIQIGNRVDTSALSNDVWTVYSIHEPRGWGHAGADERVKIIGEDFLFLLEHHRSASDIPW